MKKGRFRCVVCRKVFKVKPPEPDTCWYLECPNGCSWIVEYDNHKPYKALNTYFRWLNYKDFKLKKIK